MSWIAFAKLSEKIGQRLSGLFKMNTVTGKSLLYEAFEELKNNLGAAPKLTGDLQAVNGAVSGGADETYDVILGKAGAACTAIMGYVRNKYEAVGGPGFPFCFVQFGYSIAGGAFVPITADTSLSGTNEYMEIAPTVATSIPATAIFKARVTVPAAVTVLLGLDLAVQR